MLVLFDNGTPRDLARYLIDCHTVTEARARGWAELENGELLTVAEAAGFDVILTTDRNLRYQQNLGGRKITIVAPGPRAMDSRQATRCEGSCRGKRCDSWQLCRGGDTRGGEVVMNPRQD